MRSLINMKSTSAKLAEPRRRSHNNYIFVHDNFTKGSYEFIRKFHNLALTYFEQ